MRIHFSNATSQKKFFVRTQESPDNFHKCDIILTRKFHKCDTLLCVIFHKCEAISKVDFHKCNNSSHKKPPDPHDLGGFFRAKSEPYTPPFNVIEAPCLGCQRMARRSTTPTIQSKISAKTVSTKIPAITVLMSKTPSACRMR